MTHGKRALFFFGLSWLCVACVSNPRSSDLGPNADTHFSSTIQFAKGSAKLTTKAQRDLDGLLARARDNSGKLDTIQQITTAAWADHAATDATTLPKAERNLAQDRLRAVHGYLQAKLSDVRYRAINMAESGRALNSPAQTVARDELLFSNQNVSTAVVVLSRQ